MTKAANFGVGITLIWAGLFLAYTIHSRDPGDNTPFAVFLGAILIAPGATMIGRLIWPPEEEQKSG